jgi:lipid-binding SYLF domain-containing protein
MMRWFRLMALLSFIVSAAGTGMGPNPARDASGEQIVRDAKAALERLYKKSPAARTLGGKAKGILVLPAMTKGGFIVGGQYGEGALIQGSKTAGYCNTVQVSCGRQAGVQKYGYALFSMTESARRSMRSSSIRKG